MNWTKKHDEFVQASNISGCAEYLTRYLLRQNKFSKPIETVIDLRKFNRWVGKHRVTGQYHRKTIITAMGVVCDRTNGMFVILAQYSPYIYKIVIRPLDYLIKIENAKCAKESRVTNEKPMYSKEHRQRQYQQQQHNLNLLDQLLAKVGVKFTRDALLKIWRLANKKIDSVKDAIELMLYQNSHQVQKIHNPHGWLIECLKHGWQHGIQEYYETEIPLIYKRSDIQSFLGHIIAGLDKKQNQTQIE